MTANFNIFTQSFAHKSFTGMKYNTPITLNMNDSVYYAVLASKNTSDPLYGKGLDEFPNDKPDINYAFIPKTKENKSDTFLSSEIDTLKGLCLAAERDDGYYINDHAAILYDSTDGLFSKIRNINDIVNLSPKEIGTLMLLFSSFILPGKYWNAFYHIQHPTASIYDNTALSAEMLEIEKEWISINKSFPNAR